MVGTVPDVLNGLDNCLPQNSTLTGSIKWLERQNRKCKECGCSPILKGMIGEEWYVFECVACGARWEKPFIRKGRR